MRIDYSPSQSSAALQQQAAVKVQKLALDNMDILAEGVNRLIDSASVPQDPMLGQNIDIKV